MSQGQALETYQSLTDSILNALSEMPLTEFIALRNSLIPNELVVFTEEGDFPVYTMAEIEAWGEDAEITFADSPDEDGVIVNYHLNDEWSDIGFPSERDALIYAFENSL
jgi:hypothetical protein